MAPRDAASSMEQSIDSLKRLLTTLTTVNEDFEKQIDDLNTAHDERVKFIDELDQHLHDYSGNIKNAFDAGQSAFYGVQMELEHSPVKDKFEGILGEIEMDLDNTHEQAKSALLDGQHALEEEHDAYVTAHDDYVASLVDKMEVSNSHIDHLAQAFDELHDSLEEHHQRSLDSFHATNEHYHAHISSVSDAAPMIGALLGGLSQTVLDDFQPASAETWEGLQRHCETSVSDLQEKLERMAENPAAWFGLPWIDDLMENMVHHVEDELKQQIESAIEAALSDTVSPMAEEVEAAKAVLAAAGETATSFVPILPALKSAGDVLGAFEKILEAMNAAE